jgi:hypothetical protein
LFNIKLEETAIADEGLRILAQIPTLRWLWLSNTKITGTGADSFERQEPVELLELGECPLTHDGVAALAQARLSFPFEAKASLRLARSNLTDEDLMLFVDNDELENLDITGTKVTPQGVRRFQEARRRRFGASGQVDGLTLSSDFDQPADSAERPPAPGAQ